MEVQFPDTRDNLGHSVPISALMKRMKKPVLFGASVLMIGLLAGCVAQPDRTPELSETANAEDALPAEVDEVGGLQLDESTVRFAGDEEGWRVFIGRSAEVDDVTSYCVVAVSDDDESQGLCGDSLPVRVNVLDGPSFWFTGDTGTTPDGFEQLSPSVYWKPAE